MWCISGTRSYHDYQSFCDMMKIVQDKINLKPSFIHVGDCKGIDTLTIKWCKENDIEYKVHEAKWNEHGRAAGPIRNGQMIKLVDTLIAFPGPTSTGTQDAIRQARKLNLKIVTIKLDFKK